MGKRREQLDAFFNGMKELSKVNSEQIKSFKGLLAADLGAGVLDVKAKELMSVAVACYARCEYCIVYHVYTALKNGATRQEVIEAAFVAAAFGGGPSMTYISTALLESLDEFEGDFAK